MRPGDPHCGWAGDPRRGRARRQLIAPGITLRPETAEDEDFIRRLFIATRRAEFAPLGMSEALLEAFLGTQFELQRRHFRAVFLDADWSIVMRRREPIGRLYVAREMDARTLFDITLLPEWAGQGIGGKLIDHMLREARAAGRPVNLHVRPDNPARLLYARKGFVETGFDGANVLMRWMPPR